MALARCAIFGLGVLAPFCLFWLSFIRQGAAPDFLASFFLYPLIYGTSCASGFGGFARCVGGVLNGLSDSFVLVTMTVGAATALMLSGPATGPRRYSDPRWLILLVVVFLLVQLALTSWWFQAYIIVALGPMALLSGIIVGDYWERAWRASAKLTFAVLIAFFAGVTLAAAKTWHTNALMEKALTHFPPGLAAIPTAGSPRYAFELGDRPDFYAANGLVPASSIHFSWALPGAPEYWAYSKPKAGSAKRRWLEARQAQNLPRLYADFSKTPPSYILFRDDYMRVASGRVGIPGFQAYLDRNCKLAAQTLKDYSLYECGPRPVGEAPLRKNFGD